MHLEWLSFFFCKQPTLSSFAINFHKVRYCSWALTAVSVCVPPCEGEHSSIEDTVKKRRLLACYLDSTGKCLLWKIKDLSVNHIFFPKLSIFCTYKSGKQPLPVLWQFLWPFYSKCFCSCFSTLYWSYFSEIKLLRGWLTQMGSMVQRAGKPVSSGNRQTSCERTIKGTSLKVGMRAEMGWSLLWPHRCTQTHKPV